MVDAVEFVVMCFTSNDRSSMTYDVWTWCIQPPRRTKKLPFSHTGLDSGLSQVQISCVLVVIFPSQMEGGTPITDGRGNSPTNCAMLRERLTKDAVGVGAGCRWRGVSTSRDDFVCLCVCFCLVLQLFVQVFFWVYLKVKGAYKQLR